MNIKKSNVITSLICVAALSVASFCSGYAAGAGAAGTDSGIQYSSQGKIVFDNSTEDTADDVVFDAADFLTIDNMVRNGKTDIKNELNKYDNINLGGDIPEFNTLAASVASISSGTDAAAGNILSGKKALVGKKIVTGSMANHSGGSTSSSQVRENGTLAEITIPSGYYDGSSKITVPIEVLKQLPTINSSISRTLTCTGSVTGRVNIPYRDDMVQYCGYQISPDGRSVTITVTGSPNECPSYSWTVSIS